MNRRTSSPPSLSAKGPPPRSLSNADSDLDQTSNSAIEKDIEANAQRQNSELRETKQDSHEQPPQPSSDPPNGGYGWVVVVCV
jgi:hypothetical protein